MSLPKTPAELKKAQVWNTHLDIFKLERASARQELAVKRSIWKSTENAIKVQALETSKAQLQNKKAWDKAKLDYRQKSNAEKQLHITQMSGLHQQWQQAKMANAWAIGQQKRQLAAQMGADKLQRKMQWAEAVAAQKATLKTRYPGSGGGGNSTSGKNGFRSFGGFQFGARSGMLEMLGAAGPVGVALGGIGIAAETSLNVFKEIATVIGGIGLGAAVVTTQLTKWGVDLINFNQQAQIGIDALTNGDKGLSKDYGDYLRRTLARYTPFTTEQTLQMTPRFQSMMTGPDAFKRANFDTQLVSDIGYGLNPGRTTSAVKLSEKLLSDLMSKGYASGEEISRQAPNLGISTGLWKTAVKNIWNSEDFQKLNPGVGKLKNEADVEKKVRERQISSNVAIAAIAEVVKFRLQKDTIGEYSEWATKNTVGGLMSQIESFPTEIASAIADHGTSTGGIMRLLQSGAGMFGDTQTQERMGGQIDGAFTNFLGFGQGALDQLGKTDILGAITGGINQIDWYSFGTMFASAMNWVADAFLGIMTALGQLQPAWTAFAYEFMAAFDKETIMRNVTGLGMLALSLTKLGTGVLNILGPIGTFLGLVGTGLGLVAGDDMGETNSAEANTRAFYKNNQLTDEQKSNLINALHGAPQEAFSAGKATGAAFPAGFNVGADIHSPSRKMQRATGYLLEPLALGLEAVEKMGVKAGEKITGSFASSRTNSTRGNFAGPTFNIYQQPGEDAETLAQRIYALMVDDLRSTV